MRQGRSLNYLGSSWVGLSIVGSNVDWSETKFQHRCQCSPRDETLMRFMREILEVKFFSLLRDTLALGLGATFVLICIFLASGGSAHLVDGVRRAQ